MNAERTAALHVELPPLRESPRAHEDEEIGLALAAEDVLARLVHPLALAAQQDVAALRKRRDQRRRAHAAEFMRREQHAGIARMRRERGHAAAHRRQRVLMIERAEIVQQLHARAKTISARARSTHGKVFEIVDAARLEREQRAAEFEPADFRQRLRGTLLVLALGPKPDAVTGRGAARAAEPLLRRGAADLFDEQRVDAAMRIEPRHAREAAVDHHAHAVDGQRRLGHVGRDDDLALLRPARHGGVLLGGRKFAMQRVNAKSRR
jgi:hypothetical protein